MTAGATMSDDDVGAEHRRQLDHLTEQMKDVLVVTRDPDTAKLWVAIGAAEDAIEIGAPALDAIVDDQTDILLDGVARLPDTISQRARRVRRLQWPVDARNLSEAVHWSGQFPSPAEAPTMLEDLARVFWRCRLEDVDASNSEPGTRSDPSIASAIEALRSRGPLVHEPTGIAELDGLTGGGFVYGSRIYIAGAPDAGKTLLQLQIADVWASRGIAVGFLCVDEDREDLLGRFLQRRGVSRSDCEALAGDVFDDAVSDVARLPLRLYESTSTIEQAADDLATYAGARGARAALFIDSLQTVTCLADDDGATDQANVTARVTAIRQAATKHRLIVVTTSEMSRAAYRGGVRGDSGMDMAASKHSGAVEYSAKVLVTLRSVAGESDLAELRIAKNKYGRRTRDGESGIYLRLEPSQQRVRVDAAYSEPQKGTKETKNIHQTCQDAAFLAALLADFPASGVRDLRNRMKVRHGVGGKERVAAATLLLRDHECLVVARGPRNARPHYLIGAEVPESILNLLPASERPKVRTAAPPNDVEGVEDETVDEEAA